MKILFYSMHPNSTKNDNTKDQLAFLLFLGSRSRSRSQEARLGNRLGSSQSRHFSHFENTHITFKCFRDDLLSLIHHWNRQLKPY